MTENFTLLFLAAFTLTLATRLWLKLRQIRHVGAHRAAVPAEFAARITLASHQKAADYTVDRCQTAISAILVDAVLLLAFTLGGGLAALHGLWSAHLDGIAYGLAMIFSVLLISALADLPLSLYSQFVVEARHGFNRMTPALFVSDLGKQTLLGIAIGTPVIAAVLWLMGAMGEYWWLWVWLFWSGFNLLMLFIYPTWIAPLFNKFEPLPEGDAKTRIEALLARCGFRSNGLFVMDGSKRSAHGNAYFTGFGDNKRIVFFDTLLARLSPGEIEAVLAHELGHFRKKHIVQRIVLMFAGSLAFLWLLGQLIDAPWFYAGLGVPARDTALALILFFLVVPVFVFPLTPLSSHWSRRHEFEADAYAAAHADAGELARALVKLYDDNAATLTPDPLHSLFHDSHPPAAQRIAQLQRQEQPA
ncbi:M48 family metallopeptidase [Azonexus fungiphilus]|uniref:M48 family metallopeptidase n=1 Tax=Azonexus fungiphilus TaxID=146940 RepID=UPI00156BCD34|nr:M48 family metallopeptidase [Azonexus fungiphilus]